jgi:hypothetical protein
MPVHAYPGQSSILLNSRSVKPASLTHPFTFLLRAPLLFYDLRDCLKPLAVITCALAFVWRIIKVSLFLPIKQLTRRTEVKNNAALMICPSLGVHS